ncbi:MAG: aldehyde dehydrogenase family protein [Microbacteriaceae bacterium]|nr:aldehyde dehydrogenase family protein [Microbacteriaceae bacterium]
MRCSSPTASRAAPRPSSSRAARACTSRRSSPSGSSAAPAASPQYAPKRARETGRVTATDPARIPEIAAGVRRAFDSGRTRPIAWRLRQLAALEAMLVEREHELAAALHDDLGKSAAEAFVTELSVVRAEAATARRRLRRWLRPRPVRTGLALAPARAWTRYEPLGAVLIIGPWNYPVQLLLAPLVGALAAGDAAVLKPSELAPVTSALLAELLPNHLDREAIAVVEGGAAETQALLAQRWDRIFYTGGGRVARIVARAAAEHLTPTTLELGGKSPVYVDEGVDLAVAARRIAWGKFTNAGQTCVAPDYVLVAPGARDRLVRELGAAIAELYGPDPLESPDYGRIVSRDHFDRLSALLGDGRIAVGGTSDPEGLRLAPTVLVDVDPASPVMQEEIFGPILPVLVTPGPREAIAFVRARPKPLALYTFTGSRRVRRAFARSTSSGALVHGMTLAHLAIGELPFGGVGESGMGAYHGEASLRTFSHERAEAAKPLRPDTLALVYPPIGRAVMRLLRRLLP